MGAVVASVAAGADSFSGTPNVNTGGTGATTLSSTFSVGLTLNSGSNTRVGQSFTTGSTGFNLGSVTFYVGGQGGSTGVGVHLYSNFTGGSDTDGYVNPNNPTATDLLGSGSGLTFDVSAAGSNKLLTLTFSGADQIALAANTKYYIELSGGSAAVNLLRAGSNPYSGGNVYAGTDPTTYRGNVSSAGARDSALAVYAAVPEPASLGLLGLAGITAIRRKRKV